MPNPWIMPKSLQLSAISSKLQNNQETWRFYAVALAT